MQPLNHNLGHVSGFSPDGQWWWDGRQWTVVSQVVIPDLPEAQTERARQLIARRDQLRDAGSLAGWPIFPAALSLLAGIPYLVVERRFFQAYRQWALDMLGSATSYLFGPDEPLVAGEPSVTRPLFSQLAIPDLGVVVTAAHVLVLRMDQVNGQPRWIALAARADAVQVEAPTPVFSQPTIIVRSGSQWWSIQGSPRVMRPEPVVTAWKSAVAT